MSSFTSRMWLGFVVIVLVCNLTGHGHANGQQFYPNGRYGKRSEMQFYPSGRYARIPPLTDASRGQEMSVTFFGDGTVKCVFTGNEDYYRCSRKVDNRPVSTDAVE